MTATSRGLTKTKMKRAMKMKKKTKEMKKKMKTKKCLLTAPLLLLRWRKAQRHPYKTLPKQDVEEA